MRQRRHAAASVHAPAAGDRVRRQAGSGRDVASAAERHKAAFAKERERLIPADPAQVKTLASHYVSKELGKIIVTTRNGVTTFDFGEWKSQVASRKNDDGTISFVTTDPTNLGFEFVVAERDGKRALIIRDGQHEYLFTEAARKTL